MRNGITKIYAPKIKMDQIPTSKSLVVVWQTSVLLNEPDLRFPLFWL